MADAPVPHPADEIERPAATDVLEGLLREAASAAGYLLLRLVTDWILFADGPFFLKLRGRVYSPLFGWGRGVGVGRHVTFRAIRSVKIGDYTRIMPHAVVMGPASIGRHCFIGERDVIYPETEIGDHVALGPLVYVVTSWHDMGPPEKRAGPLRRKPVRIGNGACVNAGAMIMAGCRIGEGAVVTGGAKVTRSVPPNVVVAGNPAVIVHRMTDAP